MQCKQMDTKQTQLIIDIISVCDVIWRLWKLITIGSDHGVMQHVGKSMILDSSGQPGPTLFDAIPYNVWSVSTTHPTHADVLVSLFVLYYMIKSTRINI